MKGLREKSPLAAWFRGTGRSAEASPLARDQFTSAVDAVAVALVGAEAAAAQRTTMSDDDG